MSTVGSSGRADIGSRPRGEKADVGHPSESASRAHNDPVHAFYGRSRSSWRPYCNHGSRTVAMLWKFYVSEEHLWCVDLCKVFCSTVKQISMIWVGLGWVRSDFYRASICEGGLASRNSVCLSVCHTRGL